jgi:hypothetical protein
MNDKLEGIWKEAATAQSRETEEDHDKPQSREQMFLPPVCSSTI